MRKISIVAIAAAIMLAFSVPGSSGTAEARGWCNKHLSSKFCLKKQARKDYRENRQGRRFLKHQGHQPSPGIFTKERTKFGAKFGDRGGWSRDGRSNWGRPGWGRGPGWGPPRPYYRPDPGAAIVGGIIGGFIGNVFAPRPTVVVEDDEDRDEENGQEVVLTPWTADWYSYCGNKYESFDAKTGFYTTHDGRKVFCK